MNSETTKHKEFWSSLYFLFYSRFGLFLQESTRHNAPTIPADSRPGDEFGKFLPFGLRFNQLSVSQFQSAAVFTTYRRVKQGCFACSVTSPNS